ncbi:MAG: restriction endonuclease subunit S, partial [Cytophagales bacterium]
DLSSTISGAAQPQITRQGLSPFKIPLPPLSIQEEIVAEIEGYQKIIDGAKSVVANYKPKIDIDPDWEMVELRNIGKVRMCKRIFKKQTSVEGDVPFYKIGTFGKEADAFISNDLFTEFRDKFSYPKKGDVLISTSGTIGRTVVFDGEPAYFQDSNIVWIANDESRVLNSFLNAYYQQINWRPATGVTIARLYNKIIEETKVPIPPIGTQRQIVAQIEKEQALINSNKQLIEIFEQKIKDRIAKVWGVEKTEKETLNMTDEPVAEYEKT